MTNNELSRIALLNKLIRADGNIDDLVKNLSIHEWDFEGEPVILNKANIKSILSRFIEGELTSEIVENWAEFLELREDVDYPEQEAEVVSEIMHVLANPDLEGKLTLQFTQHLISKL